MRVREFFFRYESRLQKLHIEKRHRLFDVLVFRMISTCTVSRPATIAEILGRMLGTRNTYFVHCKISLRFE